MMNRKYIGIDTDQSYLDLTINRYKGTMEEKQ